MRGLRRGCAHTRTQDAGQHTHTNTDEGARPSRPHTVLAAVCWLFAAPTDSGHFPATSTAGGHTWGFAHPSSWWSGPAPALVWVWIPRLKQGGHTRRPGGAAVPVTCPHQTCLMPVSFSVCFVLSEGSWNVTRLVLKQKSP